MSFLAFFCFLIDFCPLLAVVRWHFGMEFCFFNVSFYHLFNTLFQMLLESCFIWGEVKEKVVILLCGRSLRGVCRVIGKESSACEFSFGPKMEIKAAVSTTRVWLCKTYTAHLQGGNYLLGYDKCTVIKNCFPRLEFDLRTEIMPTEEWCFFWQGCQLLSAA